MRPSRDPSATLSGDPWAALDATAQAELVARAEATPAELVAAAIARIERTDPFLGAVPVRSFEEAARQARELELGGELAGVPFLMKDVGARQAGHPYYAGNRALRDADHRAQEDTPLGARFRELGFVTLGSSNAPEFGLQSNTWPLARPATPGTRVARRADRRAAPVRRWRPDSSPRPTRATARGRSASPPPGVG